MERSPDEIAAALERLSVGLKDLESRVASLEGNVVAGQRAVGDFLTAPSEKMLQALDEPAVAVSVAVERETYVPIIGKAVLGIAGAYLLRALAESQTVPFALAMAAGVLYASAWMFAAVQVRRPGRFASLAYSITSVAIFAPMLWETNQRFHAINATVAAALLAAFALAGFVLSARYSRDVVGWVVGAPSISMALIFIVATRELPPFIAVLLVIAAVAEIGDAKGRWPGMRWPAASAVNLAVLDLVYVTRKGAPAEFGTGVAGGLQVATLLLYGGSALLRAFSMQRTGLFELWQPLIALWFLVRSPVAMVVAFGIAAVLAVRSLRTDVRRHAWGYLIAATVLSGLPRLAGDSLLGTATEPIPIGVWLLTAAVLASYVMGDRRLSPAIAAGAVASLATSGMVTVAGVASDASQLATSRTLFLCAVAMAVAWSGRHWSRLELSWIARATIAVVAIKLVVDDFRHARPASIALSLLCFGIVLILLPRWTRMDTTATGVPRSS